MNERIKELKIMKNIIAKYTNMKNVVNRTFMVKKTYFKCLCAVLLMIGTCAPANAGVKILEATGFQAVKAPNNATNTNNTWDPGYASGGTFGTCSTTANGVTISSSQMTINTTNFAIKKGKTFTISVSSGAIYRIVFKPKDSGNISANFSNSNGVWGGNNTWQCADNYWGFTEGKSSVTFTNNFGTNFALESINVYTYRDASAAEASFSPTSFNVTAGNVETKYTTFTTNLGTFDGANYPYLNGISAATGTSSDDIEFEGASASSYSNGSSIDINIYPYNAGNYTGEITLGRQTSADQANNYHMVSIWADFTVHVNDACTKTPTLAFATTGTINKKLGDATFTNAATSTPGIGTTGQTISYSSSDSEVATVNSSGQVTLGSKCGTTTITASVESKGTYCSASTTYTINLSGYNVTFHYPACAESSPANLTNQHGSIDLETAMAVDGYRFAGWTTAAVTTNSSSVSPLYASSVTVSSDLDLYAVYTKTSSTFTLCEKGTTLTAGEYVFAGSYSVGVTYVMTADLLSSNKLSANKTDYTITSAKTLSCQEEACIWTIAGWAGNWTIRNNSTGKYLSATGGATANSNLRLALVDTPDDYAVWTIAQASNNTTPFTTTNNKRNTDKETNKKLMGNGSYFGFYANGSSPYLFQRASASGTYTTEPDCNATEYKVTIQQQSGGTVEASASANGTWSDPVLNGMHGSETITITATPDSYHDFTSWTIVSGGVTLSASSTSNPATFTMPTNDVVIRPNYTAKSYTVTYKDKGDKAFSGSAIDASYATYTYGVGLTLPEVTKDGWVFMGWYAETDCSGSRVTSISTTDNGDKTFYALWMTYSDPLAWCPEPEVHLTNTPANIGDKNVYITSTNGKSIKAVNTLTLNAINLVPGSTVRLSTPANSGIMFSSTGVKYNATTATIDFTADVGGDITDQIVYVHYYPTSAGTGAPADVTVTATYQTNDAYYSSQDVHVRNMPSTFAIAVKQGSNWFALPANIESASQPAGVPLNVDESTWTAKGPSTLAYELWPVMSTTGSGDQYSLRGEKLRFSGNSNKGLYGSTSTTTMNNNAVISAISSTPTYGVEGSYEWAVTTTVDGSTWKYTLDAGTDKHLRYYNSSNWGTYASGVNDIYLIPLTPVETATISPMEWGEREIALKCAENTTLTKVTIDGTEVSPTPSLTSLGGDIYKITGGGMPNLSTLETYAMKPMVIEVSESSTDKQCVLTIPFILTSTNSPAATPKTAVDLRNYATGGSQDAKNTVIGVVDVVVRNGAQLDVTNAEATYCTFNDLYVYPGGKVHVNTSDLGANNVYLRGGFSWLEAVKDYRLPQMLVESGKKIQGVGTSGHGIYYDLHLDKRRYYMMSVPKDVALSSITNEEGGDEFTAWLKEYDGEGRTLSPKRNGWVNITTDKLLRGVGYEMSIKPRVNGRTIGVLRMPLLQATTWSDEAACTPSVTAWGYDNENVTANNKGWNFIGSPFFSSFRNTDENGQFGTNMEIRDMVKHMENGHWTGTYDFVTTSEVKYITIPQKMYDDYTDVRTKNYEVEAFYPFFIQAKTTGNLSFTSGSKILKAPSLFRAAVAEREVDIDFMLSDGNGRSDKAGLTVGNDYSADFDMEDKEKTIVNENYLKVYTLVGDYKTAFNSLPEAAAALPIPVGYIAPQAGTYTFSLVDGNYLEVEHVWLTDYESARTVDLLEGAYEFETAKGTNNARLVLNIILKPESHDTPTEVEEIDETDNGPTKFIYQDKMFIKQNGVIYDATGKRVREINK